MDPHRVMVYAHWFDCFSCYYIGLLDTVLFFPKLRKFKNFPFAYRFYASFYFSFLLLFFDSISIFLILFFINFFNNKKRNY